MKQDVVYLDESRDIVPASQATWIVETFYDDDGFVIRETWGRIKSVSGPAPRPRPPPPTAPAPAPPPATVPRGRVVFASIGLLALAAIGALLGLPDVVTGLLVGGGLAAGAFALLRDRL